MTVVLSDWQFELAGVPFGIRQPVIVSKFDRKGPDTRTQDQPGLGDYMNFGTDRQTPGVWSWEMFTAQPSAADALARLEEIEGAWDAEDVRATPGKVLPLRYTVAGRTRRVYGRPRRFDAPLTTLLTQGRVDIVADFQLAEPLSYDDTERAVMLSLGAAETGTPVTFPMTFPVLWGVSSGSPNTRQITVGGTKPTWLTVTFATGSAILTDPYVVIDGTPVQLDGTVSVGEPDVAMSSLPWARGVYHAADESAASLFLTTSSRLATLRVAPGLHSITFGGIDTSGDAACTVTWRNAYKSI